MAKDVDTVQNNVKPSTKQELMSARSLRINNDTEWQNNKVSIRFCSHKYQRTTKISVSNTVQGKSGYTGEKLEGSLGWHHRQVAEGVPGMVTTGRQL